MDTIVISAFPACGKSWCYNNLQDKFSMLDSDSSNYSWIKDENGKNTDKRNPDFPNNYIEHIKENLGKIDFIFVSSHENVRKALIENEIPFMMVYPEEGQLEHWIERMEKRGNDNKFISFIADNWNDIVINTIDQRRYVSELVFHLRRDEYMDESLLTFLLKNKSFINNKIE